MFSQDKFIPLKHAPIVIELELVGNPGDCLNTGTTSSVANSTSWKITEPQIKCDLVMLDSELQNSYASHLLSGKSLPIHFSSYATNVQTATGKDNSLSIARSFTRLKSVFVTMFHGDGTDANDKVANYLYHPMNATYNKDAEVEFQLQLGSAVYPQYPIRSLAEAFYSLRKTLGITNSGSVNISKRFFMHNKFVLATDLENLLGASFAGYNSKSGDLLTIKLRNAWNGANANTAPSQVHTVLHYDAILSLSDVGATVLE